MKKQFLAKLLVLAMILAMVPFAFMSVSAGSNTLYDDPYNDEDDTTTVVTTPAPSAPVEAEPEVIETIDDVKTETTEDGQTVVTATIEVTDDTADVEVSEKAIEALIEQANEGDVVVIVAPTTGEVSVPAAKLAELVEKTGNAVSVGNSVAAVAVDKALLKVAGSEPITVAPVANEDGTITITVKAGDKAIAPEDVEGGIAVEVPADNAGNVTAIDVVKADGTLVNVDFEVASGKLQVKLTVSGNIKITRG